MVTSDSALWHSRKTRFRLDHCGESGPISVQIAGSEPQQMADAARLNVDNGAQIIDINMGCPAKKVCKRAAGSALLRDETLVESILRAVTSAVPVPVTLKIRTGWAPEQRNANARSAVQEAREHGGMNGANQNFCRRSGCAKQRGGCQRVENGRSVLKHRTLSPLGYPSRFCRAR